MTVAGLAAGQPSRGSGPRGFSWVRTGVAITCRLGCAGQGGDPVQAVAMALAQGQVAGIFGPPAAAADQLPAACRTRG